MLEIILETPTWTRWNCALRDIAWSENLSGQQVCPRPGGRTLQHVGLLLDPSSASFSTPCKSSACDPSQNESRQPEDTPFCACRQPHTYNKLTNLSLLFFSVLTLAQAQALSNYYGPVKLADTRNTHSICLQACFFHASVLCAKQQIVKQRSTRMQR